MELRNQGATVYQFEGGEPFMPTPDVVKDAMKRALDDNHQFLFVGYATHERHRSLRAAIDWSFDLLGPHEQAVGFPVSWPPCGCHSCHAAPSQ